jgi:hypothetical protein
MTRHPRLFACGSGKSTQKCNGMHPYDRPVVFVTPVLCRGEVDLDVCIVRAAPFGGTLK